MGVVATGLTGEACDGMRTALSNCATFKSMTQSADAAAALLKTYPHGKTGSPARPFAIVELLDMARQMESGGLRTFYNPNGKMRVAIEVDVSKSGTVNASPATTTVFRSTALVGFANDYFKGLSVTFTSGALVGQSREVLAFDGTTGQITLVSALGSIPQLNDAFRVAGLDDADILTWFSNTIGGIIAELEVLSGSSGYLNFPRIAMTSDWGHVKADDGPDDFCGAKIEVEYGL